MGKMLDRVLDHDDRGIDQHADRDRETAETHQIRREPEHPHHQEGDERGEGQGDRHHDGGADIAEEQQQQNDDKRGRFEKRVGHGADRAVDQVGAVVENLELDAFGQARLQFVELGPGPP